MRLKLQLRITLYFTGLVFITCLLFSIAMFSVIHTIEDKLFRNYVENFSIWAINLIEYSPAGSFQNWPAGIKIYTDKTLNKPTFLKDMPPGFWEVELPERDFFVLVKAHAQSMYFITFDQTDFETREIRILFSLMLSVLTLTLLAYWTARRISASAIAPVIALANDVKNDQLISVENNFYADDEVGFLALAFAEKLTEQQEFLNRERLFTGDISHELRTPLMVMQSAVDVMSLARDRLNDQELAALARLQRALNDSAEMVAAFLQLSRAMDGFSAEQANCEINKMVEQCLDEQLRNSARPNVKIEYIQLAVLQVQANPALVAVVINNLIKNAFAYTLEGAISVVVDKQSLRITSSGDALPADISAHIFERFVKATDSSGAGIGLSIVKRICEYHHWLVTYQCHVGGHEFTITWPSDSSH
ncbi:MAG: HAMP domain-containing histidine kinase [Gammaproteobacteria bacterium]|nr:HAMP domain-containing histidine kinase [Gammaproteobacteria bacterium]